MSPVKPMSRIPPNVLSKLYETGSDRPSPLVASIANGSDVSGTPSLSSSGSFRSEMWSPSQSCGVSPAEHGSVPLSISSALV